MDVPAQCVTVGDGECHEEEEKKGEKDELVTWILVGIACAVVLILVIVIVVALCLKRKRSKDKVGPLMVVAELQLVTWNFKPSEKRLLQGSNSSGAVPTYRSFQFAESLEGTQASMSKVKGRSPTSGVPAYMPDSSNYQSITQGTNQGQSRGMVRLDELDAEEPAKYDEPTQSELDRSQKIPRDMVRSAGSAGGAAPLSEVEEGGDDDTAEQHASSSRSRRRRRRECLSPFEPPQIELQL